MNNDTAESNPKNNRPSSKGYVSRPITDVQQRSTRPKPSITQPKQPIKSEKPIKQNDAIPRQTPTPLGHHQTMVAQTASWHDTVTRARNHVPGIPTLPSPSKIKFLRSKKPVTPFITKKFRRKRIIHTGIIIVLAICTLVFILFGLDVINGITSSNKQASLDAKSLASAVVIKNASDVYLEDLPTGNDIKNYQAAPEVPKLLRINQLQILSRIVTGGTISDSMLLSPKSIYDTVWYNSSAKPGSGAGAVVIGGNSNGVSKPAILKDIGDIKIGSNIVVRRGDNKDFTYKVVAIEPVNDSTFDKTKAFKPYDPKREGLNIIQSSLRDTTNALATTPLIVVYAVRED